MRNCRLRDTYHHMLSGRLLLAPVAILTLAMSGWAANSTTLGGPVTGFIFDAPTGVLRPMLGIPGAAYLGAPLVSGVETASVAPDGSAALVVQRDGRLMLCGSLRNGTAVTVAINGAIAGVDRFAWAGDGSAAAVYASKNGQAQILSHLAQTPAAGAAIDLSAVPGQLTALAFDGQSIILGVSGDSGGVFLAVSGGAPQRIAAASTPSAIVLAGADLYFTDQQSQQIWQIQSYGGKPATVLFASDSGISSPAGLQISADGQRLYVANAGSRKLSVYDVATRSLLESLDLNFTPSRLDRFGDPSVFLLNDSGQGPLYVLSDGNPAKISVYFVPAPSHNRLRAPRPRPI